MGTTGFGADRVRGRKRVPSPPARMTAFMGSRPGRRGGDNSTLPPPEAGALTALRGVHHNPRVEPAERPHAAADLPGADAGRGPLDASRRARLPGGGDLRPRGGDRLPRWLPRAPPEPGHASRDPARPARGQAPDRGRLSVPRRDGTRARLGRDDHPGTRARGPPPAGRGRRARGAGRGLRPGSSAVGRAKVLAQSSWLLLLLPPPPCPVLRAGSSSRTQVTWATILA